MTAIVKIYVRLLGVPDVVWARGCMLMQPERRQQLLSWLALRAAPVARDRLAALFWPDRANAAARSNLRKLAFDAHELPWATDLVGDRATLNWPVNTDVAEFERALAENRLDAALALYRGPLLAGLDDRRSNAWAHALQLERARMAGRWREAARAVLEAAQGQPEETLALAQRVLDLDSLDEDAVAAAMRAHSALGQSVDALRCYRVFKERLADGLGIEPPARLQQLAQKVERGTLPHRAARPATFLAPAFVGRRDELQELTALLMRDESRLLTVTGPGGIGKSRFAKAALPGIESLFRDGVWWAPLDDVDSVGLVAPRLAQIFAIEVNQSAGAIDAVLEFVIPRELLLVLDNAEQVEGLSALLDRLVGAAPGLKVLATSRHRIGAAREWLLPLTGLSIPPADAADVRDCDSMRLFEMRASAVKPDYDAQESAPDVARLVRALGGLPLAIELAAYWTRLLPPRELVADVEGSLDLLERVEDGEERSEHRSVRATFEHSWRLLAPAEQGAFAATSVFVGTFSRTAAVAVACAPLSLLAALVDKSLLQLSADGRFSLHPLLQQFGREKARALEIQEAALQRHAEWFHRMLADCANPAPAQLRAAMLEIERDLENCRAAWRWAITHRAPALLADSASALSRYFTRRGGATACLGLFEAACAGLDPTQAADRAATASVLEAMSRLQLHGGNLEAAIATARSALRLNRQLARTDSILHCLNVIGLALRWRGEGSAALRYFNEGLRRAEACGNRRAAGLLLGNLASAETALGHYERARVHYEEAKRCNTELGNLTSVAAQLINMGNLHRRLSQWDEAKARLDEGLKLCEQLGLVTYRPSALVNLALVAFKCGDSSQAAALGHQCVGAARECGMRGFEGSALLLLARLALREQDFASARDLCRTAFEIGAQTREAPLQLGGLAAYGELRALQGELDAAAELWAYVLHHDATEAEDREDVEIKIKALPGHVARDKAPLRSSLDAVVTRVLDEIRGLEQVTGASG